MLVKTYQSLKKTKSYYIFCGNNWSFQLRDWQVVKNKYFWEQDYISAI